MAFGTRCFLAGGEGSSPLVGGSGLSSEPTLILGGRGVFLTFSTLFDEVPGVASGSAGSSSGSILVIADRAVFLGFLGLGVP